MSGGPSVYPGGPRREEDGPDRARLRPGEAVDRRYRDGSASRGRRARVMRMRLGFALALVVAGVVGFAIGLQAHRSPEEIARGLAPAESGEGVLTQERKIILRELWQMEIEETRRGGGPGR